MRIFLAFFVLGINTLVFFAVYIHFIIVNF